MDIKIKEEFRQQAIWLHQNCPVVDAHLDLAGEILLRCQAGEKEVIKNHYLEHFRQAGINLVVSSIYVDDVMLPEMGLRNALDQISALITDIESVADEVMLVKSSRDLEIAAECQKIGILLYMEGLDCIGDDLRLLPIFYELGVRGASLTWSRRNQLATGCCKASEKRQIRGGISAAGREVIKELERRSCFVDVSHLNDEGFHQLAEISSKPFLATHSNARAVYDSYRNLTDEQIIKICQRGGIIGINGCSLIAGSKEQGNHLEMLCKHIEYMVQLAGCSHIGYGFDLCDSYSRAEPRVKFEVAENDCLRNHSEMILVTAGLLQRGMDEKDVKAIIGGNFYRFFLQILEPLSGRYTPCINREKII